VGLMANGLNDMLEMVLTDVSLIGVQESLWKMWCLVYHKFCNHVRNNNVNIDN
jgi:hypothetical protein